MNRQVTDQWWRAERQRKTADSLGEAAEQTETDRRMNEKRNQYNVFTCEAL